MTIKIPALLLALLVALFTGSAQVSADAQHGKHQHGKAMREHGHDDQQEGDHHGKPTQPGMHAPHDSTPNGAAAGDNGPMMSGHNHRHDKWETAPSAYRDKRSEGWTDTAVIARGKQIFQINCAICHGSDGRGTGPAARGLSHPPADLTNHFHNKPGDGDAYLFWRVSEGGQAEPFKSMQSAMPAFKNVLSAAQRWEVLAYVHDQFHRGFKSETMAKAVTGEGNVIAVLPASNQIVVDHGAIEGFMDAMTMGYKVDAASLLDGLNPGDRIRFVIDTQSKAIIKVEKLKS